MLIYERTSKDRKKGRGLLDDTTYQMPYIKALGLVVSDKKIFFMLIPI